METSAVAGFWGGISTAVAIHKFFQVMAIPMRSGRVAQIIRAGLSKSSARVCLSVAYMLQKWRKTAK
jgi:hypothetical protein